MNILAIGGSNSSNSINRKLALYAAQLIPNASITIYDVSKIDLPLFSVQLEAEIGIHAIAVDFASQIDQADMIVLSLAENNGSYNAGFKNLVDWTSRINNRKTWGNKPMLLLATSPGARGGKTVLESAKNYFPFMGADLKGTFSLPKFGENFSEENGITNDVLKEELLSTIQSYISNL
jgi:chromate reductase